MLRGDNDCLQIPIAKQNSRPYLALLQSWFLESNVKQSLTGNIDYCYFRGLKFIAFNYHHLNY